MRTRKSRRRHRFTQNYPSERADYPSSERSAEEMQNEHQEPQARTSTYHPVEGNPDDGGKISPADAERISSEDLPTSAEPGAFSEESEDKKAA